MPNHVKQRLYVKPIYPNSQGDVVNFLDTLKRDASGSDADGNPNVATFDSFIPVPSCLKPDGGSGFVSEGFTDWCYYSRGTKWDFYKMKSYKDGFSAHTAWCIPEQIYRCMSKMFPGFVFVVEYADEDYGNNMGTNIYIKGRKVSSSNRITKTTDKYKELFSEEIKSYNSEMSNDELLTGKSLDAFVFNLRDDLDDYDFSDAILAYDGLLNKLKLTNIQLKSLLNILEHPRDDLSDSADVMLGIINNQIK